MKLTKRAIISLVLILLAFVMGFTTLTGYTLGDKLFLMIGITPWSNGQTGFHYPILITLFLLIIGLLGARKEMTRRRLLALTILCLLFSPWIASLTKPLYYKTQKGLATVEYDYSNSHFYTKSSSDIANIDLTGIIVLTNYGRTPVIVGIKLPSSGTIQQHWFAQDVVLTEENNSNQPVLITLYPGEKREVWTFSTVPSKYGSYKGQGTLNGPDLILFNEDEKRLVGKGL